MTTCILANRLQPGNVVMWFILILPAAVACELNELYPAFTALTATSSSAPVLDRRVYL